MARADLLALTEDDLAALVNRGTVKRALRELDEASVTPEVAESPTGDVTVTWSDGVVCELPVGASLHDAHCSSGAAGISRHLIRSVFAYQRKQQPAAEEAAATPAKWDPGTAITDEMLAELYRKQDLARARQRFAAGVVVELVRGVKPLARFLDESCTLRFLVPGDPRYVHADCSEQALSTFVPLAVWAFRELPADRDAGLVSIQLQSLPAPESTLAEIEKALLELAEGGLSSTGPVWAHKLTRLEAECREEGLIWPAEIIAELALEYQRYQQHDALFSLERFVDLIGELVIRIDAIRSDRGELPQLLVRGTRADRLLEIASARLIGLGCGVHTTRKTTSVTAYLQDVDSGNVAAIQREFANPADDDESAIRDFSSLAQTPILRGVSLAGIGGGQLLVKGGKRTPSCRLTLPRTGVSVNPQSFAWEKLRPPVLIESFSELESLLAILPPRSLRPRRLTEDLFVFAVRQASDAFFDGAQQAVKAKLHDASGGQAALVQPFHARAAAGIESLLTHLQKGEQLRFVSGHARRTSGGLVISPLCAVFEEGGVRTAVQPWIDARPSTSTAPSQATQQTAVAGILDDWISAIGELWLCGVARATPAIVNAWQDISRQLESNGLLRFAQHSQTIGRELSQKSTVLRWDPSIAKSQLLQLTIIARLSLES